MGKTTDVSELDSTVITDEIIVNDIQSTEILSDEDLEKEITETIQKEEAASTYMDTDYGSYINSIKDIQLLKAPEEVALATKVQAGDILAKNELIYRNLKLVVSIASHYHSDYITPMDLIQEGNIGLMTAVDKFNPTLGFRFSTYATWWIKQALQRTMANQGRVIRLPVHIVDKMNKVSSAQKHIVMESELTTPTDEQIAAYLGWTTEEVQAIKANTMDTLSYDVPVGDDDHGMSSTLSDFIQDTNADTAAVAEQRMMIDTIDEVLSVLSEREQEIIKMRMGFDGNVYTLQEIGDKYGISRERVRQIETKIMKQLRTPKNQKLLRPLL